MPTLYHAPNSRSTSIVALVEEMGVSDCVNVVEVNIHRQDGGGGPDSRNPHPEKKVPYLVYGDDHVRERGAIVAFLTDMFPESGLGRPAGHPQRGAFLSWLFYYQGVMEPVLVLDWAKIDHPAMQATFRDLDTMMDRLTDALNGQPYLLGENYSSIDLLLSSPFQWLPEALSDRPLVQSWAERCADRPKLKAIVEREQARI
ncbi:glutathione binding-like protein [uncultured Tateyamaria sp.]|uniref:glutathione S-transferase family protein n=1 Tax=uncultured Tateyamaria sp. TaxID=455651 RepID=UPI00263657F9|nr:glutathione binding-like protein [uncultured Tateyamaria sp.]